MITSNAEFLIPDLMDIVRLFPEEETPDFAHETDVRLIEGEYRFFNKFVMDGREYNYEHTVKGVGQMKSLVKRHAKLALYELLSEKYRKDLPWGSLTGVRPTRLAYMQRNAGGDFEPLFRQLRVSEENIKLVRRVIETQGERYTCRRPDDVDFYISLPFCPTKCVYCSFVTAPIDKTRQYVDAYLTALEREIESAKPLIKRLRSVYIGGGTPFVLEPDQLERVLKAVSPLVDGQEFTVEAGRADVFTEEKLQLCKDFGVTRLCINAQSFCDETLARIGRKHTARQVEEAFAMAKPYGFTLNCDLIAGLTGESKEEFCASVDKAIALAPENITVHTLCLKKGARLKEETQTLAEGSLAEMIAYSRGALARAGYDPYYLYRQKYMAGAHENVGWTKKGFASVYNIDAMEEIVDNLAVGANAISKKLQWLEGGLEDYIVRLASPKDIVTYLGKVDKIIEERNNLFG